MKHIGPISRAPRTAQGGLDPVEAIILFVYSIVFQGWDNFPSVIQNLRKYYAKT